MPFDVLERCEIRYWLGMPICLGIQVFQDENLPDTYKDNDGNEHPLLYVCVRDELGNVDRILVRPDRYELFLEELEKNGVKIDQSPGLDR